MQECRRRANQVDTGARRSQATLHAQRCGTVGWGRWARYRRCVSIRNRPSPRCSRGSSYVNASQSHPPSIRMAKRPDGMRAFILVMTITPSASYSSLRWSRLAWKLTLVQRPSSCTASFCTQISSQPAAMKRIHHATVSMNLEMPCPSIMDASRGVVGLPCAPRRCVTTSQLQLAGTFRSRSCR